MNLELGKTYKTREGFTIKIREVDFKMSCPYHGTIMDGKAVVRVASYMGNGSYTNKETRFDIVAEL